MNNYTVIFKKICFILLCLLFFVLSSLKIYNVYVYNFVNLEGSSNYELIEPFITYFNHGEYQIIPGVTQPFDYLLIRMQDTDSRSKYTKLASEITTYILVDESLYVSGKIPSTEEEPESNSNYLVLNIGTGKTQRFLTFGDMSESQQKIFKMELTNKCLIERTCYRKGTSSTSLWNLLN